MPLRQMPQYKSVDYKPLEIPQAGIGGLNLKDLEFEQQLNQSPYMLNMMYRNGSFSKRYGQRTYQTYEDEVFLMETFFGDIYVHCGSDILKNGERINIDKDDNVIEIPRQRGVFAKFYQSLYYLVGERYFSYGKDEDDAEKYVFKEVEPYIPTVFNGAEPQKEAKTAKEGEAGFGGYPMDEINIISPKFKQKYNGDGTTKAYYIKGGINDSIDWTVTPTVMVGETERTDFSLNESAGTLTFTGNAPAKDYDNVEITWTLKPDATKKDRERLLRSRFAISYGNANNTRMFLGGGGDSKYFFSAPYDATYFPESNWEVVGRSEEDITGFGLQYNTLFLFKPTEIYSLNTYTQNTTDAVSGASTTTSYFASQLVNSEKGCDAPYTIQLIDNKLCWFSSRYGICTLVSSSILDERNVRIISRNVERSNSFDVKGILDYKEDLNSIQSVDFDNKYFLCFPESGMCFVWDYQISPYYYTSSKETEVKMLDYFLFDNFHVRQFMCINGTEGSGVDLIYSSSKTRGEVVILNSSFADAIGGEEVAINSYYMTPFMQFNAIEYLKNVRDIYVQCRGDTASVIKMYYYTEQSSNRSDESDVEEIRIGGKVWRGFRWDSFQWTTVNHARAFRRRVSLKKIEMCSFLFTNDELYRDMSISHLSIFYQIIKPVR